MKITGLKTHIVGYYPDTFPGNFLLVTVSTDEGIVGVGECYACGKAKTTEAAVKELERYLLGKDPLMIEHHWQAMDRMTTHSGWILNCAMAGVEMALWDIAGKYYEAPVYDLLGGGRTRDKVRIYADIFYLPTSEETIRKVRDFVDRGYTAVKTTVLRSKEGRSLRGENLIRENVELIRSLRESVGNKIDIALDMGGRQFSPKEAIRLCQMLEDYQPLFIEEPARSDKFDVLAEISARTSVQIAAGERTYSLGSFRRLLETNAVDIIQPDISMTGLLTARKIAAIAESYEVTVAPHTPLSYVQWAASLQLDACIPNFAIQEVIPEDSVRDPDPIRKTIVAKPIPIEAGFISIGATPGLGIELNGEISTKYPYRPYDRPLQLDDDGSISTTS
jgi:galactonate dehydratase